MFYLVNCIILIYNTKIICLGQDVNIYRLVDLPEANGEKCVIIGTLFLDQRLKPSILKEISEEVC